MVEREKQFRVPTSKSALTRRLAQIPGEEINLVFDPETGQYTIESIPERALEGREIGRLSAKPFLQSVREVAFAAAREEYRHPILEGVLFKFHTNNLTLVALDGYRMSVSRVTALFAIEGEMVLDAEELKKACRTLFPRGRGARDAWVQLLSESGGVEIKSAGRETGEFVSRVEGTFPDWDQHTPGPATGGVTFQRKEFLEKLRDLDKEEPVRIEFLEEKEARKLRLWQGDINRVAKEEFLPVEGYLFSRAAFQYRYLFELLKSTYTSDTLRMELTSGPAAFRRIPDESFLHLIMPMRVPW